MSFQNHESESKTRLALFNISNVASVEFVGHIRAHKLLWFCFAGLSIGWVFFTSFFLVREVNDLPIVLLPAAIPIIFYEIVSQKLRKKFWKSFALAHHCSYAEIRDSAREAGIMFQQGYGREIKNVVMGIMDGQQVRIFEYNFKIRRGENSTIYSYTVFAFKYNGNFPHIYLNHLGDAYGISAGEEIYVPVEFSKKFRLFAPRKYEIEALQIFTPDTMRHVLDMDLACDVELVAQELLLFTVGTVNNLAELKKRFAVAHKLNAHLADKLHQMRFEPIGTCSHSLVDGGREPLKKSDLRVAESFLTELHIQNRRLASRMLAVAVATGWTSVLLAFYGFLISISFLSFGAYPQAVGDVSELLLLSPGVFGVIAIMAGYIAIRNDKTFWGAIIVGFHMLLGMVGFLWTVLLFIPAFV